MDPTLLVPLTFASHTYADFHLLMPLFILRQWQGEPKGIEGQQLRWATVNELEGMASTGQLVAADLPLVAHVSATML